MCMNTSYVTKSGRVSKQRFADLSFRNNLKTAIKMPIFNDVSQGSGNGGGENPNQQEIEIARLKVLLAEKDRQLQQSREAQQPIREQVEVNQGELRPIDRVCGNLLSSLNLDIKMPKFSDETKMNPKEYLEKLKSFKKLKNIDDKLVLLILEHSLEGRARLWYDLNANFETFDDFQTEFLDEFYSIPVRVKIKNLWVARRYTSNVSFPEYFYSQSKESSFFIPELTTYEINYTIIQQFPTWVRDHLVMIDFNETKHIVQSLTNLEANRKEKESRSVSHIPKERFFAPKVNKVNFHRSGYNSNRHPVYENSYSNNGYYNDNRAGMSRNQQSLNLPDTRFPPPLYQDNNRLGDGRSSVVNSNFGNSSRDLN